MHTLDNVRFQAWHNTLRGESYGMIALYADVPGFEDERISIYIEDKEFRQIVKNGGGIVNDVSVIVKVAGDYWHVLRHYTDFSQPHGIAKCPFVNFKLPLFAAKIILKWAEHIWKTAPKEERIAVEIDQNRLERWCKLYGQGTGQVEVIIDDDSKEFLNTKLSEEKTNLNDMVERINTIALNKTHAFWEKSRVYLSKDCYGFFWRVENGMHGGIINHGKEKPDWSIHT